MTAPIEDRAGSPSAPDPDKDLYYYTVEGIRNPGTIHEWQARVYAGAEEAKSGGKWEKLVAGSRVPCEEPLRVKEARVVAAKRTIQAARIKKKEPPSELEYDWEPGRGLVPRKDED